MQSQSTRQRNHLLCIRHIHAQRPRAHRQPLLRLDLHLHHKQHRFPTALDDIDALRWTSHLLLCRHCVLWTHYPLHRIYHHLAANDRSSRSPRHFHVGHFPWPQLPHLHLVSSGCFVGAADIGFPTHTFPCLASQSSIIERNMSRQTFMRLSIYVLTINCRYTRREQQLRFAFLQSGEVIVLATGSIVNYGLNHLDHHSKLRGWRCE